ncbi:nucleoside phosphorylase [Microbacterium sp. P05]|uniref:phosphorylase family protein n=1 Tax=Microbacterium sp. P05 TaxID=3366948 RepID=UPI003746F1F4
MRLLVAAHASELVAFDGDLPGFDRLLTGVGKIPAAYALTRALDATTYEEIVVVGTAGAIDPDLEAGVYDIDATLQHDVKDLDGVIGQHISLPARVQVRAEGVTIATGDHFIDDADAVMAIRALGARLVDMESYAYAWVAGQFGVPIRILKAVSDRAQDGASDEWDDAALVCSGWLRGAIRELYGV